MTTHLSKEVYEKLVGKSIDIKTNKYHNKKIEYDGIIFDSKKEGNRYWQLKQFEKLGYIKDLKMQVPYLLIDTIRYKGKTYPKTQYYADFQYIEVSTGKIIVEDVKSEITRKDKTYRIKIKLLLTKYPEIDFEEIC